MNIPKTLKVGGLIYKVLLVSKEDIPSGTCGEMDCEQLTIKVVKTAHPRAQEIIFLHEIIHAINNELKETDVEFLAQMLYQVFVDNKKVFRGGELNE